MLVDAADGAIEAGDSQQRHAGCDGRGKADDRCAAAADAIGASARRAAVVRDPEQIQQMVEQIKELFSRRGAAAALADVRSAD